MIDAASQGLVDFRQADLNSPLFWRRLTIMLQSLSRQKDAEVSRAKFDYYLANINSGDLSDSSREAARQAATETYFDLIGTVRPWEGRGFKDKKKKEFKDARQLYIDKYGVDPVDPRFKQWEAEQIAKMNQRTAAARGRQNDPLAIIAQRKAQQHNRRHRR